MSAGARSPQGPIGGPAGHEQAPADVAKGRRLDPAKDPQAADGSAPGVRRRRRRQAGDGRRLWSVTVRLSLWERALVSSAAARAGGLSAGAWLAQAAVRQAEADIATGTEAAGGRDRESAPTVGEWPADAPDEPLAGPWTGSGAVGAGVVVGELRAAVRQLVRYGVLLNQLVAQVHATGDVEGLAGGLRIAVDRCETRSAAVAVLAAELAATAGVTASSTTRAAAGPAVNRRDGTQDAADGAVGGGGAG